MATEASLKYVQQMFVAYLGRAATGSAQTYYADLIDANESTGKAQMFDDLYNSAEGKALYGSMTVDQVVEQIFQNCFERDPAFTGLTYYYDEINKGTFNILEAAAVIADDASSPADVAVYDAKKTAADKITTELGSDATKIAGYTGNAAEARTSLNKVTDATSAAAYDAAAEVTAISGGNQIGGTFTLTTAQDIPSLTANNDTIVGAQTTYGATDVISDASTTDADVMTVTATADITATPTVSGVETINFNLDSFTAAGGNAANFEIAANNIANGNINVNVTKTGSSVATGVVTGLATGSNVTFGSAIVTAATVTGVADNEALTVTAGSATITADSAGTLTGATMTGTGAATTTTTFVSNSDAALTATTTLSDMTVTAAAAKTVNLTSAKDIDANTTDLTAATTVNLTAGNEMTVGLDAATVATLSGAGTTNSTIDDAAGNTLTTLNLSGNGAAHTFDVSNSEGVKTVTMTGDQDVTMIITSAAVDALTNNQLTVTDSTTAGTTTVDLAGVGANAVDTSTIGADVIEISAANTGTILTASGQTLTLSADQTTFALDGSDTGAASNTATLILDDGVTTANATVDIANSLTLTDLSAVTIDVSKDSFTTTGFTPSSITNITGSADNTSVTINAGANGVTLAGTHDLSAATGGGALVINSDGVVGLGASVFDVASLTHTGSGAVTHTAAKSAELNAVTTGSGIDTLTWTALTESLTLNTGGGNDSVILNASTAAAKTYTIDLGDGTTDTLTLSNTVDLNNGTSFSLSNTEILNFANGTTAVTVATGLLSGANYLLKHATAADTLIITAELGATDTSADFSSLVVDGASLTAADSIVVDGSAKTSALSLAGVNTISNTLTGGTKNDTITGGDVADTLDGRAGADIINGGAGDDIITGGDGGDVLTGGTGNNTYVYAGADADTGESITFNTTTGATETISATGNVDATAINAGALLTGLDAVSLATGVTLTVGGAQVTGLTVAVTGVNGGATETMVVQGTGQDNVITIANFAQTDATLQLDGLGGDDTLTGDANGITVINGGSGADTITGGSAADIITGGAGADIISSGTGNDIITYSATTDAGAAGSLVATAGDAIDSTWVQGGDKLHFIGDFAFGNMTGTAANAANAIANTAGIDFNAGGTGDDTVQVIAGGGALATITDLLTLADLNTGMGGITNEAVGDERILIFNAGTDNKAAIYYYTGVTANGSLAANELQLLGIVDDNGIVVGDIGFT